MNAIPPDTGGIMRDHTFYMQKALEQARKAETCGEVPVGAVLVDANGKILAETFNQTIGLNDPTAHAEILSLRKSGEIVRNYRLLNTSLYVTVEPCAMCMGAVIHARINRVIFGVHDPKWGAAGSVYDFATDGRFNHRPEIVSGICERDCRDLLVNFFRVRRKS